MIRPRVPPRMWRFTSFVVYPASRPVLARNGPSFLPIRALLLAMIAAHGSTTRSLLGAIRTERLASVPPQLQKSTCPQTVLRVANFWADAAAGLASQDQEARFAQPRAGPPAGIFLSFLQAGSERSPAPVLRLSNHLDAVPVHIEPDLPLSISCLAFIPQYRAGDHEEFQPQYFRIGSGGIQSAPAHSGRRLAIRGFRRAALRGRQAA